MKVRKEAAQHALVNVGTVPKCNVAVAWTIEYEIATVAKPGWVDAASACSSCKLRHVLSVPSALAGSGVYVHRRDSRRWEVGRVTPNATCAHSATSSVARSGVDYAILHVPRILANAA